MDVLKLRARAGFTVMELVVAMGIFGIIMAAAVSIFVFTSAAQRRSRAVQEAWTELEVLTEAIAREVRTGQLDYVAYDPATERLPDQSTGPMAELKLRDTSGQAVRFRYATDEGRGLVELCRGETCDSGGWHALSGDEINVTRFSVWAGPAANPFFVDRLNPSIYPANDQPWVTIVIGIQPRRVGSALLPEVVAQTTIANRTYLR